jgi:hypothetical protein
MNNGKLSFLGKVKGLLGNPVDTFNNLEREALGSALKYFAIWAVVYAVLQTVFFYVLGVGVLQTLWGWLGLGPVVVYDFNPVLYGLVSLAGAFAGLFISGSWAHLFVRAFGGRKGYENTIKAFAYGYTPVLMFGWIPFVGALFSVWALILDIIGVRQVHGISTGRAIGAVLLSIAALVVIVVLIELGVVLTAVLHATA